MIFKNVNAVFPSVFIVIFFFFFSSFCRIQYALLNVLFQFFSFLNSFKCFSTQVNVTEVEVSVRMEQKQRRISHMIDQV